MPEYEILIVEDEPDTGTLLEEGLRKRGFRATFVGDARACLERLATAAVDIVVTDVQMPEMSGIELCVELGQRYPDILPIIVTGAGTLDIAIAAMRAGAYDFIVKPVKLDLLAVTVQRAQEHARLKRELAALRVASLESFVRDGIAGTSPAITELRDLIRQCAASDATVSITGESGSGKELVARALHALSPRANQPFVAINCAAMPAGLLESELFGHVRGAFTDAKTARRGLFQQAGHGTVFLDEISELGIDLQVKLLRVLQERKFRPVGGDEELAVAARVVTATNRDLDLEVDEGRFRQDLFFRINVVGVRVPPLRERAEDILMLAQYFLRRAAARVGKPVERISQPAAKLLLEYDWPGNVRELENCMERALALCRLDEVTVDELPDAVIAHARSLVVPTQAVPELVTLHEVERRYVQRVLRAMNGNKTQAARVLGMDRRSLYRRLAETDE